MKNGMLLGEKCQLHIPIHSIILCLLLFSTTHQVRLNNTTDKTKKRRTFFSGAEQIETSWKKWTILQPKVVVHRHLNYFHSCYCLKTYSTRGSDWKPRALMCLIQRMKTGLNQASGDGRLEPHVWDQQNTNTLFMVTMIVQG